MSNLGYSCLTLPDLFIMCWQVIPYTLLSSNTTQTSLLHVEFESVVLSVMLKIDTPTIGHYITSIVKFERILPVIFW